MLLDTNNLQKQHNEYTQRNWITFPVADKTALTRYSELTLEDSARLDLRRYSNATALAVLPKASQLLVLDLDSIALVNDFINTCDLAHTLQASTPSGCRHFFYQVPDMMVSNIETMPKRGADFDVLWNNYAVLPESQGRAWLNELEPLQLTPQRFIQLIEWINNHRGIRAAARQQHQDNQQSRAGDEFPQITNPAYTKRFQNEPAPAEQSSRQPEPEQCSPFTVAAIYRERASKYGRNHGAFLAALYARDHGMSERSAYSALETAFINAPAPADHRHETAEQRQTELQKTIASAYSRPPAETASSHTRPSQLWDSVRERLAQQGLTNLARAYDALIIAGYGAGDTITRAEARKATAGLVGRDGLYDALEAENQHGMIFRQKVSPPPLPKRANAAVQPSAVITDKCLSVGVKKPVKTSDGGRPQYVYTMPTVEMVARWSGAEIHKWVTKLSAEQIASVKTYRASLYESLIERRPGKYDRAWQADRLGVTKQTTRNYDSAREIVVTADYERTPLNSWSLSSVMPADADFNTPDRFLIDQNGKKYPALRVIAVRLLAAGLSVSLMEQTANIYHTKDQIQSTYGNTNTADKIHQDYPKASKHRKRGFKPAPLSVPASAPADTPEVATMPPATSDETEIHWINGVPETFEQFARALDTVYERAYQPTWNGITGTRPILTPPKRTLDQPADTTSQTIDNVQRLIPSLAAGRIRKLINSYGADTVMSAATHTSKRKNIGNAAGFLIVLLRSESKKKGLQNV